jgi:hypothetical protein
LKRSTKPASRSSASRVRRFAVTSSQTPAGAGRLQWLSAAIGAQRAESDRKAQGGTVGKEAVISLFDWSLGQNHR